MDTSRPLFHFSEDALASAGAARAVGQASAADCDWTACLAGVDQTQLSTSPDIGFEELPEQVERAGS